MTQSNSEIVFEFSVTLDELVDSGGMDGLNDILKSRLSYIGFQHTPMNISYKIIGHAPGDDTSADLIILLASYLPDYIVH